MSTVISVENLGKKYLLSHQTQQQPYVALRDVIAERTAAIGRRLIHPFSRLISPSSNPQPLVPASEDFWALKDVSFEIKQGDRVGIIGRNGAGKSTLLKILSRIVEPTTGRVRIKGRVASLLEVGTGFHPELTGRENIFLNGAILGMTRVEIKKKFDEIVDFAEIEKFLDTPVKRYSSGMYVRLAFAVAAHLEPEILLVDEVLAVGDAQFQKKCLGKMEEVSSKGGRTVLFVSHNMGAVKSLCQRALCFEGGYIKSIGDVEHVVRNYLSIDNDTCGASIFLDNKHQKPAQITEISVVDLSGNLLINLPHTEPFVIKVTVTVGQRQPSSYVAIHVVDSDLQTIIFSRNFTPGQNGAEILEKGVYIYSIIVPSPLLIPGTYRLCVHLATASPPEIVDGIDNVCPFEIIDAGSVYAEKGFPWRGKISTPLEWAMVYFPLAGGVGSKI